MKTTIIVSFLLLMIEIAGHTQDYRYFQFKTECGHENWQDTSFIAAASEQALIDTVRANLSRPANKRQFISGPIDYGHGGHNHNNTHWFSWHFVPDQWELVDLATEVCDGCPYTNVDSDTAYWIGKLGRFCPWSGIPVKEVSEPTGEIYGYNLQNDVFIYPNPVSDDLYVKRDRKHPIYVTIYNSTGVVMSTYELSKQKEKIDIHDLQQGVYFLKIRDGNAIHRKKIIVTGNSYN